MFLVFVVENALNTKDQFDPGTWSQYRVMYLCRNIPFLFGPQGFLGGKKCRERSSNRIWVLNWMSMGRSNCIVCTFSNNFIPLHIPKWETFKLVCKGFIDYAYYICMLDYARYPHYVIEFSNKWLVQWFIG